jgi:hypothetical protein
MPMIINRNLLTVCNVATVGVIAIIAHMLIKPLYSLVSGATQGN